jgi:uncharacterized membrane protein YdfJ with MMPL/SSD domain
MAADATVIATAEIVILAAAATALPTASIVVLAAAATVLAVASVVDTMAVKLPVIPAVVVVAVENNGAKGGSYSDSFARASWLLK